MANQTHRLVVPRAARYVTDRSIEGPLDEVWILCHGYGQLASEFLGLARALEGPRRLLVAPEALSRFYHEDHKRIGASWMTREDRDVEMEDYVRYLDLLHDQLFEIVARDRLELRLLGYSQGAATAARWAVRGRAKIDHLVLWGSPLPPELGTEAAAVAALREMRLTLVGGSRDQFFTEKVWAEERTRLRALGIDFDELSFEGGHRLDDDTLRALAG